MNYRRTNVRPIQKRQSRLARLRQPKVFYPVLLVLVLAGSALAYGLTRPPALTANQQEKKSDTTIPDAKSQTAPMPASDSPAPVPSNSSDKTPPATPPDPSVTLKEPYGNFVSAHQVPAGAKGEPQESVCTTTPGASCTIVFTQGSTTKSLPLKTTDANGTAYWSWTPDSLQLTAGNWTITAKATLGAQTKQAVDARPLEIP